MSILYGNIKTRIIKRIPKCILDVYHLLTGTLHASPDAVERAEQIFYINYLRKGMTVFDVGANIGELTILFSRFIQPGGKVYSFEASSVTFDKLKTICNLLNRDNIELKHIAVSDCNKHLEIFIYPQEYSSWNSLADRPLASYGIDVKAVGKERVLSTTIDVFCKENNISHIDLLKIDVEGAEYQVLLGARHMLEQKRIACCVFEFGATTFDMGNTPKIIENYLSQLGYRVRNIVPRNECFPGRECAESAKFSIHVAEPYTG